MVTGYTFKGEKNLGAKDWISVDCLYNLLCNHKLKMFDLQWAKINVTNGTDISRFKRFCSSME